MRALFKVILIFVLLLGCRKSNDTVVIPLPPSVPIAGCTTPQFSSKDKLNDSYVQAIALIKKYANSDEFIRYLQSKRTKFSHTEIEASMAIKMWREQLAKCDTINIEFYKPLYPSKTIGGWSGNKIIQNLKYDMIAEQRAGHLLHETSHKYGWIHKGNYSDKYDNKNSFPYSVGYDFEDFLLAKPTATPFVAVDP
jgi:hypothetical protein